MTIQIQRKKSDFVYKINEHQPRQILVRPNRHNARWRVYGSFDTPQQATAALLKLDGTDAQGEQGA